MTFPQHTQEQLPLKKPSFHREYTVFFWMNLTQIISSAWHQRCIRQYAVYEQGLFVRTRKNGQACGFESFALVTRAKLWWMGQSFNVCRMFCQAAHTQNVHHRKWYINPAKHKGERHTPNYKSIIWSWKRDDAVINARHFCPSTLSLG